MNVDITRVDLEKYAVPLVSALLILLVGWWLANRVARLVERLAQKDSRISPTLVPLFTKLTRLTLLAVVLLAALEKVGVQTTSFLALLGAAGLAVGLALKDTMADVASGVVLLVLRPFDIGDAVLVGGTGGIVEAIDIFQTRLLSFDGVPIVLGNSAVRASIIQNFSRSQRRRIDLQVGISYQDDIGRAKQVVDEVLRADTRVLTDPAHDVFVDNLGDSSVVLLLRCWTMPADFLATKSDLTRALKERLTASGISIPFPQRDVHLIRSDAA